MELPPHLREALDRAGAGIPVRELAGATQRLVERYRAGEPATSPILATATDVAAYAIYRMPATYAAMRSALAALVAAAPTLAPVSHVDVGGGTGAAAWAARDAFPGLAATTVLDQVSGALTMGRALAEGSRLGATVWTQSTVDLPVPAADLVTVSYVLGELTGEQRADLLGRAVVATGRAIVIVEPGTPAGYERILAARAELIRSGLTIAAPCPHAAGCPLPAGRDWCHFGVRIGRSARHRLVKDGDLSYEDEKFTYVAAARVPVTPAAGRVLRPPQQRKGLVTLSLCTGAGAGPELVSKRQGAAYRAARDVRWGDAWPAG